jgi:hypothetical protein
MMKNLGLTLDELTEVGRTCDAIEIECCTPPYLKDFIVARLAGAFPEVSATVGHWNDEQMHAVCEHIKATFALLRCAP